MLVGVAARRRATLNQSVFWKRADADAARAPQQQRTIEHLGFRLIVKPSRERLVRNATHDSMTIHKRERRREARRDFIGDFCSLHSFLTDVRKIRRSKGTGDPS